MKKGDLVTIWDGSYNIKVVKGEGLKHSYGIALEDRVYKIIDMDKNFPTDNSMAKLLNTKKEINDLKIRDIDNGEIIFTKKRFCRKYHNPIHDYYYYSLHSARIEEFLSTQQKKENYVLDMSNFEEKCVCGRDYIGFEVSINGVKSKVCVECLSELGKMIIDALK